MSGILNNIYDNIGYALRLNGAELMRLQEQAATGSRVNRPSDDPSSAYRILTLSSQDRSLANYMDNIAGALGALETASSVVTSMTSAVVDAKTQVTQIVSGVYNDENRQRTAEAIDEALEQLVQYANTRYMDEYLFAGASSGAAPYVVQRTDGEITSVSYEGSRQGRSINIAPGVQSSPYYAGEDLFRSSERRAPVFGTTTAQAGTGTSSVTGDVWLQVTYDGANYQVSIDGGISSVTVPAGGSANQAITDSRTGKVLYVDTTGINAEGTELVRVPGTHDIFNSLITIRDLLRNEQGLPDAQVQEYALAAAQSLDEMKNLLVQGQASMGSKINFLNNMKDSLQSIKYNGEDEAAMLEDADIAMIAIDLSRRETLYQMSLAAAGKLMSLSLLDFLE